MIGEVIVDGFKFGLSLKRMLPYIFINLLLLFTVCDMLGRIGPMEMTEEAMKTMAPLYSLYLFIFLIYGISQPLFMGMILHQAKNFPKKISIKKSFKFSFSVFLKSFFIFLALFAIFGLLGFVPFLWPILILLFGLASLYVYPIAIMDNKKITESFKRSFLLFRRHPLQTFLVCLLVSLISLALVIISFVPLIFWIAGNMFSIYREGGDIAILVNYLSRLLLSPTIIPFLLLPSFAIAFVSVMKIGTIAMLYLALKKKA